MRARTPASSPPSSTFVAVVALALGLAACTGSGSPSPSAASTSASASASASANATASASAASASPSASLSPSPSAQTTGTLTVLDWSGYEQEMFWPDFKAKYPDATVNFDFGQSDADIYGKMKAGIQADVFHPYTGWLQFYVDEGLVQEVDTSRLANWAKVPDHFKEIGQIDGKQYFVPWDWGFTSILYRTDKVEGTIDSWAALMDEKYKGHVSMWDDGPGAVTVSSYIHGYDETAITPEQLEEIKAEWTAQRELNLTYWAAEPDLIQSVKSGDVWVAYAWQGAYATLLGEGVPVAYANPKEGRNSWVGVYGISANSPNTDLAHRFLDEKLATLTGNNLVENYYYGHTNQEVMAGITDDTLKEAFSVDDPTILQKTNFTPNLTAEQRDAWTQMWTEVKAGQ
jgi:spermidine/putrescine transport system substrate-binding protein